MDKYILDINWANLCLAMGFIFGLGFEIWARIHNEIRTLFGIPLYTYAIIFLILGVFRFSKRKK